MDIRYTVQDDSMKPRYAWCYLCSFATLEDARKFIEKEKEKKINPKIKYRILKQTTEMVESEE